MPSVRRRSPGRRGAPRPHALPRPVSAAGGIDGRIHEDLRVGSGAAAVIAAGDERERGHQQEQDDDVERMKPLLGGADHTHKPARRKSSALAGRCPRRRPPRVAARVGPMAIRKIAGSVGPVLREQVAREVTRDELAAPAMQRFIDDLVETMRDADGAGLAANQVYEPIRICAIEVRNNPRYPYKPNIPLTILVNPVLTPVGDEQFDNYEGCLSRAQPARRGRSATSTSASARGTATATPIDEVVHGLTAGTYQHEVDHLARQGVRRPRRPEHVHDVDRVRAPPPRGVRRAGAALVAASVPETPSNYRASSAVIVIDKLRTGAVTFETRRPSLQFVHCQPHPPPPEEILRRLPKKSHRRQDDPARAVPRSFHRCHRR